MTTLSKLELIRECSQLRKERDEAVGRVAILEDCLKRFAALAKRLETRSCVDADAWTNCGRCHKCVNDSAWMILCPTCGNKRCPHATDHALACTNSNEPGQKGSVYGVPETPSTCPTRRSE